MTERLRTKYMVYVLDLNSFNMHMYRYSLTETVLETVLKDNFPNEIVVVSKDNKLMKIHKRFLPVTDRKSPVIVYSFVSQRSRKFRDLLKGRLFQSALDYFSNQIAESMKNEEVNKIKCVLRNTFNVIETCTEHIQLSKTHMALYCNHVGEIQAELANKFKFFQVQIQQLFSYHTPDHDFKQIVDEISNLTTDALHVSLDKMISWVQECNDVQENENVTAFKQHITLLEQHKLSSTNKDHINQIKISMTSAMESVLDNIESYLIEYNQTFSDLRTQLNTINSLSNKIEFAIHQANTIISEEIGLQRNTR